ncbi:hypothetical protein SAMN05216315_10813 [Nitrosospira sp. Nsp18]|uniref:hypothetical protein n=1 Tax=Nitrosospira sp. Nsp18 TaxID=1855334 RepID=UPI000892116B|nr:hypothetical protein [Nitrosospira sp. Nsp18]SDA16533.1 hypothetical protein SAMN05216315_10813 [Nitrosospira sp. Nsp18]
MTHALYTSNIFINFPFDKDYLELRNAMLFAIFDCGFVPRCALEEDNGGNVRVEKIHRLIKDSKYGIHDISRTELDPKNDLPRFNMPLELGVFLGAKKFGNGSHKDKSCLIVDKEQYRYQKYLSDIAGHDVRSHKNSPDNLIQVIRDWLKTESGRKSIPGGKAITNKFYLFKSDLPSLCKNAKIEMDELNYNDYSNFVSEWLIKLTSKN